MSDLPPDRFKAKFQKGTLINDQLRRARYQFGQDLRPPPVSRAEAETRLKEHLGKAEDQKAELDASRVAKEYTGRLYLLVLGTTAISVVLLTILLMRRR